MAKKVLGKGLSAIISSSPTPVDEMEAVIGESRERIVELDVELIKPNPDQPRLHFDLANIEHFQGAVRLLGIAQFHLFSTAFAIVH